LRSGRGKSVSARTGSTRRWPLRELRELTTYKYRSGRRRSTWRDDIQASGRVYPGRLIGQKMLYGVLILIAAAGMLASSSDDRAARTRHIAAPDDSARRSRMWTDNTDNKGGRRDRKKKRERKPKKSHIREVLDSGQHRTDRHESMRAGWNSACK